MRLQWADVRRGLAHVLLPIHAYRQVLSIRESLARLRALSRGSAAIYNGKIVDLSGLSPEQAEEVQLARRGREMVIALPEHERFAYMAQALGWNQVSLSDRKKALARAHTVRFCFLLFVLIAGAGAWLRFGSIPAIFALLLSIYAFAACVKAACFYTQVDEQALWSLGQLWKRPRFWLIRRSLWFLE